MVRSHFLDLVSYHKTLGNRLTFSFTIFFSPDFTSLITLPEIQESSELLCGLLVIMIRWGPRADDALPTYFYQLYQGPLTLNLLNLGNLSSLKRIVFHSAQVMNTAIDNFCTRFYKHMRLVFYTQLESI